MQDLAPGLGPRAGAAHGRPRPRALPRAGLRARSRAAAASAAARVAARLAAVFERVLDHPPGPVGAVRHAIQVDGAYVSPVLILRDLDSGTAVLRDGVDGLATLPDEHADQLVLDLHRNLAGLGRQRRQSGISNRLRFIKLLVVGVLAGAAERFLDHLLRELHALGRPRDVHQALVRAVGRGVLGDIDARTALLLKILDGVAILADQDADKLVGHLHHERIRVRGSRQLAGLVQGVLDHGLRLFDANLGAAEVDRPLAIGAGLRYIDSGATVLLELLHNLAATADDLTD
mmetsp:Transcript_1008/g.2927  ORF Transcript_1008/g.2927 Transcript_1008/m.2927 type:complete len:289 (-) Transcript_1008:1254-2120(-)